MRNHSVSSVVILRNHAFITDKEKQDDSRYAPVFGKQVEEEWDGKRRGYIEVLF